MYPLSVRAVWYTSLLLTNSLLSQDISDSRRSIILGSSLIMLGGWFDFVLMYCGVFLVGSKFMSFNIYCDVLTINFVNVGFYSDV